MTTLWFDPGVKALFNEAPWDTDLKVYLNSQTCHKCDVTGLLCTTASLRKKVTKHWKVYSRLPPQSGMRMTVLSLKFTGRSDWIISGLNAYLDKVVAYIVSWLPGWQYDYGWPFLRSQWLMHQQNTPERGTDRDWPGPFHWGSPSPSASSSSSSSVQRFSPFSSSSPSSGTARDSCVLGSVSKQVEQFDDRELTFKNHTYSENNQSLCLCDIKFFVQYRFFLHDQLIACYSLLM